MCDDAGEGPAVQWLEWRTARKSHWCCSCGEDILPGHRYHHYRGIWDGSPGTFKHCARCWAIFDALVDQLDPGDTVDMELNCGETWDSVFGPPPDHIAALAFALPGEVRP